MTNNSTSEKFSYKNKNDLLALRKQIISDSQFEGQELIEVQKYFTSLLSLLLTGEITLISTTYVFANSYYPYLIFTYFSFPVMMFVLSNAALDNCWRAYRNSMEYHAVRMKLDELLGMFDKDIYEELKKDSLSKLFNKDEVFGNPRWQHDRDEKWQNCSSEEFINKIKTDLKGAYFYYSVVFKTFKWVSIIFLLLLSLITVYLFLFVK
jgi:hypothetical protein